MNRRTWLMVALFLLLGAGAFYALRQKNAQSGTRNSWDTEFAVDNPEDIHKIFLADRSGRTATLEREGDHWMYNGKYRARPTAVQTLMETLTRVKVYYVPPEAAKDNAVRDIAASGIKVELYNKAGKPLKVYYVGGVNNEESGTYMMMEGAKQPYVTHIPGFVGQLRVRFFLDEDSWRDRAVFSEKPEDIQSVSVEYPQQKSESFRLEKTGPAEYAVKPFFSTTHRNPNPQRKGVPEAYLLEFESKIAEAFETRNPRRDSVTALVPFAIVSVKKTDGTEKRARFWPVSVERTYDTKEIYVVRYFTELNGDFLLTQEQVFSPIFRGYDFFFQGTPQPKVLQ